MRGSSHSASAQFVDADRPGGLDHGEVHVAEVEGAGSGEGGDVQVGDDGLGVGTLVAGHLRLGHHRVDHPAVVRVDRVGAPPDEHGTGPLDPAAAVQGVHRAAQRGGVARHHPGEVAVERPLVVDLGAERVAGQLVLLAALPDGLDPRRLVALLVAGRQPLGPAVRDHVDLPQQVVQASRHRDPGRVHLLGRVAGRGEHPVATFDRHPGPEVGHHVDDADQLHVVLKGDGIGDPLADHPVAVDRYSWPLSGHRTPPRCGGHHTDQSRQTVVVDREAGSRWLDGPRPLAVRQGGGGGRPGESYTTSLSAGR